MTRLILPTLLLFSLVSLGQEKLDNGVYIGYKMGGLEICFLNYTDSIAKVEFFNKKSKWIFGHYPTVKLLPFDTKSKRVTYFLKSNGNSVSVYKKHDKLIAQTKMFGKIKLHKISDNDTILNSYYNNHAYFVFSHSLQRELEIKNNFDINEYFKQLNSYNLDNFYHLDTLEFNNKLKKTEKEIKAKWN